MVDHFCSFEKEQRRLPVMWHQCLLAFVQHYKGELTTEQKERMKHLMRLQNHRLITAEVRRELFSVPARDAVPGLPAAPAAFGAM